LPTVGALPPETNHRIIAHLVQYQDETLWEILASAAAGLAMLALDNDKKFL
jgi:hypothetical protein